MITLFLLCIHRILLFEHFFFFVMFSSLFFFYCFSLYSSSNRNDTRLTHLDFYLYNDVVAVYFTYVKRQREKWHRRDGKGHGRRVSFPSENPSTPYNRSPTFRPHPPKLRRFSSFLWSRWLLLYRAARTCCRRNNELAPRGVPQLTVILIRNDPNYLNAKRRNTCPLPGLLICAIRAMPPFLA